MPPKGSKRAASPTGGGKRQKVSAAETQKQVSAPRMTTRSSMSAARNEQPMPNEAEEQFHSDSDTENEEVTEEHVSDSRFTRLENTVGELKQGMAHLLSIISKGKSLPGANPSATNVSRGITPGTSGIIETHHRTESLPSSNNNQSFINTDYGTGGVFPPSSVRVGSLTSSAAVHTTDARLPSPLVDDASGARLTLPTAASQSGARLPSPATAVTLGARLTSPTAAGIGTSSTGEIGTFNYHSPVCPMPPIGQSISNKMKDKIWSMKYIDFYDLLFPDNDAPCALGVSNIANAGDPSLTYIPKKRRNITDREWSRAFDEFVAIYAERYPDQLNDLLSYSKFIKNLMRNDANWQLYDRKFRQDREFSHCSFGTVRVDLHVEAYTSKISRQVASQADNSSNKFRTSTKESENIPLGYCKFYHTAKLTCSYKPCKYKHECPKCKLVHPIFKPCAKSDKPK